MKKIVMAVAVVGLLASCGGKEKKEENGGFELSRTKTEAPKEDTANKGGVPVDMSNKGIGPVTSVTFDDEINTELAAQGEAKYKTICVACHMPDKKLIGPALAGIYERRSPEWVMNMILNPAEMVQKDPIAKALFTEYNNAIMTPSGFSEEDARAVAEYLRTF